MMHHLSLIALILFCSSSFPLNSLAADPDESSTLAGLFAALRQNKDICESLVIAAKTDGLHRRDLAKGARLYGEAMAEYNAAIAFARTAVALSSEAEFPKSIQPRCRTAQEKASEFIGWYTSALPVTSPRRQNNYARAAGSPAVVIALLPVAVEGFKLAWDMWKTAKEAELEKYAQQRAVIREDLAQCFWARWDQLGGNTVSAASPHVFRQPTHCCKRRFRR